MTWNAGSFQFKPGHIPDPAHRRTQRSSRLLLGTSPQFPSQGSLERFEGATFDQGSFGSCGGHGTSQAVQIAAASSSASNPAYIPLPWRPSPDWVYKSTRLVMRAALATMTEDALTDSGSYPNAIMAALSLDGVIPYHGPTADGRVSDCDESTINEEGALSDFEAGQLWVVTGEYRVDNTAPDFTSQLASAIASGFSVGLGLKVDTAFIAWGSGWSATRAPVSSINLSDPNGGGHWICCDAYDLAASPDGVFSGPNSWSDGWGAPALVDSSHCPNPGGHWRITGNCLRTAVSDAYIFKTQVFATKPAPEAIAHLLWKAT